MVEAIRYAPAHRSEWDRFIDSSKNGTFLFKRDFMEYHADRFPDHSLLFLDDKQALRAVLPATGEGAVLHSHKGLTYGGVISDARMKGELMAEVFEALRRCAASAGIARASIAASPTSITASPPRRISTSSIASAPRSSAEDSPRRSQAGTASPSTVEGGGG